MKVRVWKTDPERVIAALLAWAETMARDPDVIAVVLFGSYTRGDATAMSDADVLVLLRGSDLSFEERSVRYKPIGLGVPVDVFAYTLAEARDALAQGWGVVAPALREGRVLWQRHAGWIEALVGM